MNTRKCYKVAFAGFRHGHIIELYNQMKQCSDFEITAATEDHSETATALANKGVELTHDSVDALFENADSFDVVAIGDYYTRRGDLAIRALKAKKHIILDKPICTRLEELDAIEELSAKHNLSVFCQLGNRGKGQLRTLKRLVNEGAIGTVHTVNFMGQHPLMYRSRPAWYFEDGKHGGTINDIAIHALDILPWLLGCGFREALAARTWNNRLPEVPSFQTCAQMMLTMENGIGVLGDVSYLSPDSQGYKVPHYWRYTLHGDGGILETSVTQDKVRLWQDGKTDEIAIQLDPSIDKLYLKDFIYELNGEKDKCDLTTEQVINSSRIALRIQQAADTKTTRMSLVAGK